MRKNRIISISLVALASVLMGASPATQPASLPQAQPEKISEISFSQLKAYLEAPKDKAVLVNFWGTFCPPCVKELPDLAKLQEVYKDRLQVVLVTMDDDGDVGLAEKLLKDIKVTTPSWHMPNSEQEKALGLHPQFTDLVFPSSFLYDKSGKQVKIIIGKAHDFSGWETFIKPVLP